MPIADIDMTRLPKHIAVIMDGNGRWAKRHGLSRAAGHEAGAKSVRAVVRACRELGLEALTLFAFSTENWRRSKHEVTTLFRLLGRYVNLEIENIHAEDIRVTVMGRMDQLSTRVRADLQRCVEMTKDNQSMVLNIAINYGGRAEIVDAAKALADEVGNGKRTAESIDETIFSQHLYLPTLPDPDLLIRTSGELRISNFMLWQLSYAEIVAIKTLWPDFRRRHLVQAIAEFQTRQRRFGGRS